MICTEKLVAILRDGRKYIGVLRSWDQFGMLVRKAMLATTTGRWRGLGEEPGRGHSRRIEQHLLTILGRQHRAAGHGGADIRRQSVRGCPERAFPHPRRERVAFGRSGEYLGQLSQVRSPIHRTQDLDKDDYVPEPYKKGDVDEVYTLYKQESEAKKAKDKSKLKAMTGLGFVDGETGAEGL